MKSLFNDERLYGNLVMEQDTPTEEGNTNIDGNVAKTVKTPPKPTAEELEKQGYGDQLPEGEKVDDYDVKEDNTGKKWYKIKDAVKQQRAKAIEDQKAIEEKYKKFKEEKLVADADGNEWKIVDKNHKMDEENYAYLESPINPTTKESEKYYKPKEKTRLNKKEKRYGQCKKLLKDLVDDFGSQVSKKEMETFIRKIKTDDKTDVDAKRVKQLQYCIKTNSDKLKKNSDYKIFINQFTKIYGEYVAKEPELDDSKDTEEEKKKEPKWVFADRATALKLVKGSKNKWIIKAKRGYKIAFKDGDDWKIPSSLKSRIENKIMDEMGYSEIENLVILKDNRAPKRLEIQVVGKYEN